MTIRKWGTETLVNTTTAGNQQTPTITTLADGGYVITWIDEGATPENPVFQIFNADGTPRGVETALMNVSIDRLFSDITALDGGGFAISFVNEFSTDDLDVLVRSFDSLGVQTDSATINQGPNNQDAVASAALGTGSVHVYRNENVNGGDIEFRILDTNLDLVTIGTANTTITDPRTDPDVVELAGGRFAVVWESGDSDIRGRVFEADGTPVANDFLIATGLNSTARDPQMAALNNGGFVVTYRDASAPFPENNGGIRAQILDSNGTPYGPEIIVNSSFPGPEFYSDVTALPNGGFFIAWADFGDGVDPADTVRGQLFDALGNRVGTETIINTGDFFHDQNFSVAVTALADGRIVVTYANNDASADGSSAGIQSQILDPRDGVVFGTSAAESLYGNTVDDEINGFGGNDTIVGMQGNDIIFAGSGNDVADGGIGNDIIYAGNGHDNLFGGEGDDTLFGQNGDDIIYAYNGDDRVFGGAGDDFLYGANGADFIRGEDGNDEIYGGSDGSSDFLEGGAGDDTIDGGGGDDALTGGADNDSIDGGDGNDFVLGGTGDDIIFGGTGADFLFGDDGSDTIYGQNDNDTISGGGANDRIFAGNGNDEVNGDAGFDFIRGEAGNDTLFGGNGNDTVEGSDGLDVLYGQNGDDSIQGGSGNDRIFAGNDNDNITGDAGNDLVRGENGDDFVLGGNGNDTVEGGTGNDSVYGQNGNDVITGGTGADRIFGGTGADQIDGGADNDFVRGDAGNDTLTGGAGNDTLTGSADADTFIFNIGGDDDRIQDFEIGIDALHLDADLLGSATTGASVISQFGTIVGGTATLTFDMHTSLTLNGLSSFTGLADDITII